MATEKRKNQEFRNFTSGIVYFLCIALALFLITLGALNLAPDIPKLVDFDRWSSITDAINLVIGLPIAFAGAYVAISIAGRAADISEKQQSQQDHLYYEQLHEQLIDNYFAIAQSANQLVSAANRFEESFYTLLKRETASKYAVINFVDDDHRRKYIQEMLVQNRNGITDALNGIHDDIKQQIFQLLESIDLAFKYASVNETWQVATSAPGYRSLLSEACQRGLFDGEFSPGLSGQEWLINARSEIMERLDLHQINHTIAAGQNSAHPLLPYCLYICELNDYASQNRGAASSWNMEVLLAGYFLMTHACRSESAERIYFNSGALFLVDLINNLPTSEHIRLAFAKRFVHTETAFTGSSLQALGDDLYGSALNAYEGLDRNRQRLFLLLAENIQFAHYSTRIRKGRELAEQLLDCTPVADGVPLLRIRYELLSSSNEDK